MDREVLLDEAVTAWLQAAESGQQPSEQEWIRRYPDLADELRAFFASEKSIGRAAAPLRQHMEDPSHQPTVPPEKGM